LREKGGGAGPDCGATLLGDWVQRTQERKVLEVPQAPLRVIEHATCTPVPAVWQARCAAPRPGWGGAG